MVHAIPSRANRTFDFLVKGKAFHRSSSPTFTIICIPHRPREFFFSFWILLDIPSFSSHQTHSRTNNKPPKFHLQFFTTCRSNMLNYHFTTCFCIFAMISNRVMSFCVAPDDNKYDPILIADCQAYVFHFLHLASMTYWHKRCDFSHFFFLSKRALATLPYDQDLCLKDKTRGVTASFKTCTVREFSD